MTDSPRKPFWKRKRWIPAAVLWLVVMYPVGYGPACWTVWNTRHPWIRDAIGFAYRPIDELVLRGPAWVSNPLRSYMSLWDTRHDHQPPPL